MYQQEPSGPQGPQQWQPYPPQWQPPPQKRRAWPWVLLGFGGASVFYLLVGGACMAAVVSESAQEAETASDTTDEGPADAPEDDTVETEEEPVEAEETVGMGEPGTVGQWEVTVDSIDTSPTHGDEFSMEEAQGEFKLVSLTVQNVGDEATYFDESGVYLVGDDGNRHTSSTTWSDDSLFFEQINPGNEVSGTAVVDVPEGTEIDSVEIEDIESLEGPLVIQAE